eukprot:m.58727 g.58727  ORF g.58727 m.58727 type:complete len:477 (+) comp13786_c0_seq1:115-1545(+)
MFTVATDNYERLAGSDQSRPSGAISSKKGLRRVKLQDQTNSNFSSRCTSPAATLRQLELNPAGSKDLKRDLSTTLKQLHRASKDKDKAIQNLESLKHTLKDVRKRNTELESTNAKLKQHLTQVVTSKAAAVKLVDKEAARNKRSSEAIRQELMDLQTELEEGQQERAKLINAVDQLERRVKRFRKDRMDSEQLVKELSDKLALSFDERDQLKSQCNQLKSQTYRVLEQLQAINGRRSRPVSYLAEDSAIYELKRDPAPVTDGPAVMIDHPEKLDDSHAGLDVSEPTSTGELERLQNQIDHLQSAIQKMRQRDQDAQQEHALHTDKMLKLLTEERQRNNELAALLRAEREAKRQALVNHDRAIQETRQSLSTTLRLQEEHHIIHQRLDVTLREYQSLLALCRPYLQVLANKQGESAPEASMLLKSHGSVQIEALCHERDVLKAEVTKLRKRLRHFDRSMSSRLIVPRAANGSRISSV